MYQQKKQNINCSFNLVCDTWLNSKLGDHSQHEVMNHTAIILQILKHIRKLRGL